MKKLLFIAMIFSLAVFGRAEKTTVGTLVATNEGQFQVNTILYKEPVRMSALPKFAQRYLKENYPVRQIKQITKVREEGKVRYEVGIHIEGKMEIVQFDAKGEYIEEETKK